MTNFVFAVSFLLTLFDLSLANNERKETTDLLFLSDCHHQHNHFRRIHRSPDLEYDYEALEMARKKVEQLGKLSSDKSLLFSNYSVNEAWATGKEVQNCRQVVSEWYKLAKYYNFNKGLVSKKVEPFANMIWKSSIKFGCAQMIYNKKSDQGVYTVCVYSPKPNLKSMSKSNICPPLSV